MLSSSAPQSNLTLLNRRRSCAAAAALCLLAAAAWAQTTTISGTVYDPRTTSALPLPNVLVYVTAGAVAPLSSGVECLKVSAPSNAASYASTDVDGNFTLRKVPVNASYTLVIQAGKWRRQFPVAVATTPLAGLALHMPADHTQGDIPLIAIATGQADGAECVLHDMGIADTEFTDDTGKVNPGGRIHLYQGSGAGGAYITPSTPADTALTDHADILDSYDMVMFPCQGGAYARDKTALGNVVSYANAGGRVFTTHYSYVWLDPGDGFNSQFPPVANWDINQNAPYPDPGIATVNTDFTDGATLAQWLKNAGATYQDSSDQIQIGTLRHDFDTVIPPTQAWLTLNNPAADNPVMQITFNTPVGAAANAQCGRVLFNEYHVIDQQIAPEPYPAECPAVSTPSAQEEMLEYALFDLSAFVRPVVTPTLRIAFDPSPLIVKQGDTGVQVAIDVANTSSTVDIDSSAALAITLPPNLTATALADSTGGWSCALRSLTCTRNTSIGSSTTDPAALTLSVGHYPSGAPPTALITATVSSPTFSSNVTATDKVIFQQAPPIAWATPAPIVYGTPLTALQLDATSPLPGAFTYTPAAGTELPAGQHTLSVNFAPTDSTDYTPGSASVSLTVVPAIPQVQVTASANPSFVSNAITFTARVASSATTPTGTVTFYDGAAPLGQARLSAGTATLTTAALAFGRHSITAAYGGDANYQASASGGLPVNIEDFSLAIAASAGGSATVYPGTVASYPLLISPLGGSTLASDVTMTIAGLPPGTTASFTPDAAPANSGATPLTLHVTPQAVDAMRAPRNTGALPLALGLLLVPFAARLRRTRKRLLLLLALALAAAIGSVLTACSSTTWTPHSYPLTITARSGNLSHTTRVTFTVE